MIFSSICLTLSHSFSPSHCPSLSHSISFCLTLSQPVSLFLFQSLGLSHAVLLQVSWYVLVHLSFFVTFSQSVAVCFKNPLSSHSVLLRTPQKMFIKKLAIHFSLYLTSVSICLTLLHSILLFSRTLSLFLTLSHSHSVCV